MCGAIPCSYTKPEVKDMDKTEAVADCGALLKSTTGN